MNHPSLEPIEIGDEEGCGYSYEHTLNVLGPGHWECTECGAEVFDMDVEEAAEQWLS